MRQTLVIVDDSGESWCLEGDKDNKREENNILPELLSAGWEVVSATAGSGSKDDSAYWLVVLAKK